MTMTAEVAILRAYAFASQGKYDEAEQLLASVPEVLNTPSGADLLARIKFEQGDESTARRIWEELLAVDPSSESARIALAALDSSSGFSAAEDAEPCFCHRFKYSCVVVFAVLLGVAFSIGKMCGGKGQPATTPKESSPVVVAEQSIPVRKINDALVSSLNDWVLTNITDSTVLVLTGGSRKSIAGRLNQLSFLAESIKKESNVPLPPILFQALDHESDSITLSIWQSNIPSGNGGINEPQSK